jgi:DNA-binding MarR family transcriptional regulator
MSDALGHDGRRGPEYVERLASRYSERFPSAGVAALRVSQAINACFNSKKAALARMYDSLGYGGALGRSSLLHALYFADGGPLTHSEISNELQIAPASVTYLVDGLEKEGLVLRTIDPSNRRTVHVELTDQGHQVAATLTPAIPEYAAALCKGLSEDEKETLTILLFRVLENAAGAYKSEVVATGTTD